MRKTIQTAQASDVAEGESVQKCSLVPIRAIQTEVLPLVKNKPLDGRFWPKAVLHLFVRFWAKMDEYANVMRALR
jgi:hypothetical protein